MAQHTQGTWIALTDNNGPYMIQARQEAQGAVVFSNVCSMIEGKAAQELQANARLIAAAPDMLAALALVIDYHVQGINPLADAAILSARAAVNKAQGV